MVRKSPPLDKKNEELLSGYLKSKTNCEPKTVKNYRALARIYVNWLNRPMDRATSKDVLDFVTDFKRAKRSSRIFMISFLKDLYSWLYSLDDKNAKLYGVAYLKRNRKYKDKGKYPPIVEDLKRPKKKRTLKTYPTTEELIKIIACCDKLIDKALIATGYETATAGRADKELLDMKIGDLTIKNNCAYIQIPESKSTPRTTVVKKFIRELRAWLDVHPKADDPDAYLWPSTRNDRMSYSMADITFKRACVRAGVKKYPLRSLRHRRAKDLENVLGIREKMAYFGWSTISTAQIYGEFTSEESCDRIVASEEGRELKREEELKSWMCPGCKTENSPAARFCQNCTQPKDDVTAIRASKETDIKLDNIMELLVQQMLSNPQFKEQLTTMLLGSMMNGVAGKQEAQVRA